VSDNLAKYTDLPGATALAGISRYFYGQLSAVRKKMGNEVPSLQMAKFMEVTQSIIDGLTGSIYSISAVSVLYYIRGFTDFWNVDLKDNSYTDNCR
jgi:hypothetical protein